MLYAINKNLDLNVKEVVVVNWKSVADTVDALGGLDINIKDSEIKEMNKYIQDTYKNIGGSNARDRDRRQADFKRQPGCYLCPDP